MSRLKYKVDPLVYSQLEETGASEQAARAKAAAPRQPGKAGELPREAAGPVGRASSGAQGRGSKAAPFPENVPVTVDLRPGSSRRRAQSSTGTAGARSATRSGNGPGAGEQGAQPGRRPMRQPGQREELRAQQALRRAQGFVVGAFLGTLFLFGILSLTLEKPTRSEYERRELAEMPAFSAHELFWGSYLREVEEHYADTFPFRETFVQVAARFGELRGVRLGGARILETTPRTNTETAPPVPPVPVPEDPASGVEELPGEELPGTVPFQMQDDGGEGEQTENGLFLYGGRAMDIFGGSYEMGSWYADILNRYAQRFGADVQVYNIVVPTSIEFYLPERYRSVTGQEKPQIDHIYEQLDGVAAVDAYTAISHHAGEYVYFNTDHHWTALGAYYAYTAYCEAAGLTPLALEDYEKRSVAGEFLGTFYSQTYDSELKNAADTVDYYIVPGEFEAVRYEKGQPGTPTGHTVWAEYDYVSGGNAYAVFLGGDYPLIHIGTDNRNGRSCVLVKESYGNAFAPFLLAHYQDVYVVDLRYYEQGLVSLVAREGIDDVIFLNNAFAANTSYRLNDLEGLLY